jgi:hypothetical protein
MVKMAFTADFRKADDTGTTKLMVDRYYLKKQKYGKQRNKKGYQLPPSCAFCGKNGFLNPAFFRYFVSSKNVRFLVH